MTPKLVILSLDGPPGSGKTLLLKQLVKLLSSKNAKGIFSIRIVEHEHKLIINHNIDAYANPT